MNMFEAILDLSAESRAYYHAYELTGDESLLLTAHQLEMDATYLEVKENDPMIEAITNQLSEDFTEIEYKGSKGAYELFTADDKEIRADIGYSEHLGQQYAVIEQYNNGWREITTLHIPKGAK